ncbi:MAG: RNA polymerase sigma factor [Bryobacteraceae bacterium]|nr:RNA polymerase sigma factor [Bryobacteraceae bacterium]
MTSSDFAKAYQAGFPKTLRFLIGKGIRQHLAEEYAQEAWAIGWERLPQLRDDRLVYSWVTQIAWNETCRHFEFANRVVPLRECPAREVSPTLAITLRQVLSACSPDEQTLLCQVMEGLTPAEIGTLAGCTAGAVRIRLMRARRAAARYFYDGRSSHAELVHQAA